jgi:hypothetical protein
MCKVAAGAGLAELAYQELFTALDEGRPLAARATKTLGLPRFMQASGLFVFDGIALRRDPRFTKLCARLGLVDYWRTSGHWPDCVEEVPYDFKAECEKAARS